MQYFYFDLAVGAWIALNYEVKYWGVGGQTQETNQFFF